MPLNLKKTIKPRGGGSKSTTTGGLGSFGPPSGVETPAGTKGGSSAGMIDKPRPMNSPSGKSKGGGGSSIKSRLRAKNKTRNY